MQAGQLEFRLSQDPPDRVGGGAGAEREAEFLVLDAGSHRRVDARVDPGVTRTSTRCLGRASGWASAAILAISPAESSTIRPTP